MRCTLLGTGTSHGIPVIGCDCECCRSLDPRDNRTRCAMWITDYDDSDELTTSILIDAGPDFRNQALRFGIKKLDAVLLTHGHADHLNGIDDIRIFSHTCSCEPPDAEGNQRIHPETEGEGLPVYANEATLKDLYKRFSYVFHPTMEGGGKPKIHAIDCSPYSVQNPLIIDQISIIPIPMLHGSLETTGWLIGKNDKYIAYLTDCNKIPDSSMEILHAFSGKIEHLIIDGLRNRQHSTHFSFAEASATASMICAKYSWFTHICHDMTHKKIERSFAQQNIAPAYDGLVLDF